MEYLAIKKAVRYWQHWLIGKSFTVYSDHKPLENMNLKSRTDEELSDLTYYLSQYDFKIKYASRKEKERKLKIIHMINLKEIKIDQERNNDKQNVYFKKDNKKEKIILSEQFSIKLINVRIVVGN